MHDSLKELLDTHEEKLKLLLVEDEETVLEMLKEILERYFVHVDTAKNGKEALDLFKAKKHDIVVSDISIPKINGIKLAESLKQFNSNQPIVIVSAHDSSENLFQLINIGVSNFIIKPIESQKLLNTLYRIAQKIFLEKDNLRYATTDILTGLYNRFKFDELASMEMQKARRYGLPLSLIMFDIDHFKVVNDTYGHLRGDDVLKKIASIARNELRTVDVIARWGGEEFVIMLPDTPMGGANLVAERIRKSIESTPFDECGTVTSSFGIASYQNEEAVSTFIKRADDCLYAAKASGRNRVCYDSCGGNDAPLSE